ncbi:hypothetical protein J6590_107291, partial [Homalodisca vitripennis]
MREVKDEVYKAYVKKKDEAKTEYVEAVQAGQSARHVVLEKAWSPTSIYSSAPRTVLDSSFVIEATPKNIAAAHSYLKNYTDLG